MLQNWRHLARRPIFSMCRCVSAGARSHRHEGPDKRAAAASWPGRAGGARGCSEEPTSAGLDEAGAAGRWALSGGSQGLGHRAAPDQLPQVWGPREPCRGPLPGLCRRPPAACGSRADGPRAGGGRVRSLSCSGLPLPAVCRPVLVWDAELIWGLLSAEKCVNLVAAIEARRKVEKQQNNLLRRCSQCN